MSYPGRFKSLTLFFALPAAILSSGLMIYFRQSCSIGYIVMSQISLAVGGGAIMITYGIAISIAVQEQQYFAVTITLVSTCSNIGVAVGLMVLSAIWQDVVPDSLLCTCQRLIYMDITTQLSYPVCLTSQNRNSTRVW
jgi:hypothetical protein